MTAVEAPSVKRRSKRAWVVGLLVLLVVALAAVGWSAWITHTYERDFDRWVKNEKSELTSTASFTPISAMDYPGAVNTDDRQAQEAGCAELGPAREKREAAAAALPASQIGLCFLNSIRPTGARWIAMNVDIAWSAPIEPKPTR